MMTSAAKAISAVEFLSLCCNRSDNASKLATPLNVLMRHRSSYSRSSDSIQGNIVDAYCGTGPYSLEHGSDDVDTLTVWNPEHFTRLAFITPTAASVGVVTRNLSRLSSHVGNPPNVVIPRRHWEDSTELHSGGDSATQLLPRLCDVYPSSLLLTQHLCYGPLNDTLLACQRRAVKLLMSSTGHNLAEHFRFFRRAFFLGDGSHIFEPIREQLLVQRISVALSPLMRPALTGSQSSHWRPKDAQLVRSMCRSVETNVHTILPPNIAEGMVSVDTLPDREVEQSEERQSKDSETVNGGSRGLMVDHFLKALSVQIHLTAPLVEIITGPQITTYNSLLKVLLRNQICLWSAEMLWMKITSAHAPLNIFCSQCQKDARDHAVTHTGITTILDPPLMLQTCASGIQWLLHITKALQSFYLHHLHNTHLRVLERSIRHSHSVSEIISSHEEYMQSASECVTFLSAKVDSVINAGLYAVGRLEEAFAAADAAQSVFLEQVEPNSDPRKIGKSTTNFSDATAGILRSRLGHTSRAFSSTRERIKDLISTLDDITAVGSNHPSSNGVVRSDRVGESLPWHLTLWYAHSLKALFGEDASERLKPS